jgi:hypothetical protein
MKFKLKRSYKVNEHKTLKAGQVMDVTEEFFAWLQENDYDKKEKKIKEKKTKTASDKEQEL